MQTQTLCTRAAACLLTLILVLFSIPAISPLHAKAFDYRENGVDVSVYQGDIDWPMLAANNDMRFVIMRACKLATPDSEFFVDTKFEENYANARAIGLKVGVYCYCGADTREGILETTQQYIDTIQGKTFDYPVYLDVEADEMTVIPKEDLTEYLLEALGMLKDAGFHPGVYANLNWYTNFIDGGAIKAAGYDLWLARYTHDCDIADFSADYSVWQYSNRGVYTGMTGTAIDLDVSYVDYAYDGDHGRVPDTAYTPYLPLKACVAEDRNYQPYYADMETPIPNAAVFPADECIIREVYQNGWCRFTYPVTGGSKVGYLPLDSFLTAKPSDFRPLYSPAKVYTFSRPDMTARTGYIGPYDTLYVTAETDDLVQILYSVTVDKTAGKKLAWLSKKDWDLALMLLLQEHIHGQAPLREEQVPFLDINADGILDTYDLSFFKRKLDGLPLPFETDTLTGSGASAPVPAMLDAPAPVSIESC